MALLVFWIAAAGAQPGPGPGSAPAAAPAPAASAPAVSAGQYPRSPNGFFRGNGNQSPGFYLNLWGLVPVLGLFLLWVHTTQWADEDARGLKINHELWNSLLILVGALGFLAVLALPSFFLGFLALIAAYGVPLGMYIKERNDRVPESAKVMTPRHIQSLIIRGFAMIGINIAPSKESRDSALGPPIRFLGKSDGKGNDAGRSKQAEKSRGFVAAKELIYDAIMRRATDVHMEPKEDEYSARYRIDGVMYPTEPFDRAMGESIINIFKVLGAMDITEKRKSQDGSFRAQLEKRMIDFRAATQGTREGEKISLRILDQANSVSKLEQLNMRKQMQEQLREVINQPHGLFLSCGPTGAGKSTTLYAALNELDAFQQNIITVEDPVEYKIANVTQIEVNTKAGNTFGNSLRSILRQDPDVVMIGEIRDAETAKIACQAANTGHMVFSTVHANDTISALYRIIDLGVEPFLLSSALSAILGQRLVRRLCDECKEKYAPKPDLLKQAGLPADKVDAFYRPPTNADGVCPNCGGLGYRGRMGVFELLVITDRLRDMIRENAPVTAIRAEARKNGMLYMKEEGLRLVVKGMTSIQELQTNVK
ncbi:MAG: type II/IV secretion system protein [Planctomycetia bacterium]|nr:type II/IV secretion system protein [Planctomycetia bacterium]